MKDFRKNISFILKQLKSAEVVIFMFDFDGTLSPIAPTPKQAFLPVSTKKILEKLCKFSFVAIITGRSLEDIKKKVGIKKIIYAGNHGTEWQIGKQKKTIKISRLSCQKLAEVERKFKDLVSRYPSLLVDEKKQGFSVHYRKLSASRQSKFSKEAEKIIASYKRSKFISFFYGKKVLEAVAKTGWNKGKFAKFLIGYLKKKYKKDILPVYIGDDTTDESVFLNLKTAITARVSRDKKSFAKYFIKNQRDVNKALHYFLNALYKRD